MRLPSLLSLHSPLYPSIPLSIPSPPLLSPLHHSPSPSHVLYPSARSLSSLPLHSSLLCSIPLLIPLFLPLSTPSFCSSLSPSLSPLLLYLSQRHRSSVTPSGTRSPWPAGRSVSLSAHAPPQCALPRPWPSPPIPREWPSAGSPGSDVVPSCHSAGGRVSRGRVTVRWVLI